MQKKNITLDCSPTRKDHRRNIALSNFKSTDRATEFFRRHKLVPATATMLVHRVGPRSVVVFVVIIIIISSRTAMTTFCEVYINLPQLAT
jgi:hypothetical protein